MAFPQVLGKSIPQGTTTHLAQSQSLGNRRDDEIRIAEGVEGDKPDAVRKYICHLGGDVESQPGFANAARASEGHMADV